MRLLRGQIARDRHARKREYTSRVQLPSPKGSRTRCRRGNRDHAGRDYRESKRGKERPVRSRVADRDDSPFDIGRMFGKRCRERQSHGTACAYRKQKIAVLASLFTVEQHARVAIDFDAQPESRDD